MTAVLVKGGLVLQGAGPVRADVLCQGGLVRKVAPAVESEADVDLVIDATGCWVGPGFVDLHVHFREPGQEHKEDIESGSRAAAAGGYTAVVAMPNTSPPADTADVVTMMHDRATAVGLVELRAAGCLTKGRAGQSPADLEELWSAGVRVFSDDGDAVVDAEILKAALEFVGSRGGVVSQHALEPDLAIGRHLHDGRAATRQGLVGIPIAAETKRIEKDLGILRSVGGRYHVQHISSAAGVALIAAAKAEGLAVTAEVTPHHLAFTDDDLGSGDTNMKMMPPLRSAEDREALRTGLEDGVIDAVATDHAPHSPGEKQVPFEQAPNGVIGLQWAAAVVNTVTDLDFAAFFERLSVAPARIGGLTTTQGQRVEPGQVANLVVFDPTTSAAGAASISKSSNSPFTNRTWKGLVRATVHRGTVTFEQERVG